MDRSTVHRHLSPWTGSKSFAPFILTAETHKIISNENKTMKLRDGRAYEYPGHATRAGPEAVPSFSFFTPNNNDNNNDDDDEPIDLTKEDDKEETSTPLPRRINKCRVLQAAVVVAALTLLIPISHTYCSTSLQDLALSVAKQAAKNFLSMFLLPLSLKGYEHSRNSKPLGQLQVKEDLAHFAMLQYRSIVLPKDTFEPAPHPDACQYTAKIISTAVCFDSVFSPKGTPRNLMNTKSFKTLPLPVRKEIVKQATLGKSRMHSEGNVVNGQGTQAWHYLAFWSTNLTVRSDLLADFSICAVVAAYEFDQKETMGYEESIIERVVDHKLDPDMTRRPMFRNFSLHQHQILHTFMALEAVKKALILPDIHRRLEKHETTDTAFSHREFQKLLWKGPQETV